MWSPLGTGPADSRFCSRNASYTVLHATPDFAAAFIKTIVRDRFVRRPERNVTLSEITERFRARLTADRLQNWPSLSTDVTPEESAT